MAELEEEQEYNLDSLINQGDVQKVDNIINDQTKYLLNPDYTDWTNDKSKNNFNAEEIKNLNYLSYPWNTQATLHKNVLRTYSDDRYIGIRNISNLDGIEEAHNKKMTLKNNIFNSIDINKVKSYDNPVLKTSKEELEDIRKRTLEVVEMIKDQGTLNEEKNRAFEIIENNENNNEYWQIPPDEYNEEYII
jgi:hypothetical protein